MATRMIPIPVLLMINTKPYHIMDAVYYSPLCYGMTVSVPDEYTVGGPVDRPN